jgi:hypothetical protein
MFDESLRKFAFFIVKEFPWLKELKALVKLRKPDKSLYKNYLMKDGLMEYRRYQLAINKWVKTEWNSKVLGGIPWFEEKSKHLSHIQTASFMNSLSPVTTDLATPTIRIL